MRMPALARLCGVRTRTCTRATSSGGLCGAHPDKSTSRNARDFATASFEVRMATASVLSMMVSYNQQKNRPNCAYIYMARKHPPQHPPWAWHWPWSLLARYPGRVPGRGPPWFFSSTAKTQLRKMRRNPIRGPRHPRTHKNPLLLPSFPSPSFPPPFPFLSLSSFLCHTHRRITRFLGEARAGECTPTPTPPSSSSGGDRRARVVSLRGASAAARAQRQEDPGLTQTANPFVG